MAIEGRAILPDQRFTIDELIAERGKVAVTWFWKGMHKGDILGFRASGKAITTSGMTVYYFDGSRLTGHWQLADRLGVYQQLSQ